MNRLVATLAAAMLMLVSAPSAYASVFKVGTGKGCTHSTIQAAVDAANASPGLDKIIITRSLTYTAQAVKLQQERDLILTGGYATCASSAPSGGATQISGNGGAADSVFTVETGNADVVFENLYIADGDDSDIHYGGGIDFTGSGNLTLIDVSLTNNTAGYGGGLSARGTGIEATVTFSGEVLIAVNHATKDGGGVHLRGTISLFANEPGTTIWSNTATGLANSPPGTYHGYGGGIAVVGPAKAYIGSVGYGDGAIYSNTARAGGGIAALASGDNSARVYLFTNDPTRPQKIHHNRATDAGGAFYADANRSLSDISSGNVSLRETNVENNSAPIGAIAYLASDSYSTEVEGAGLYIASGDPLFDGVICNAGVVCNVAKGNRSVDVANNPTNGALVHSTEEAKVSIYNYRFTQNTARSLLDLKSPFRVSLSNTLIDNNSFSTAVLQFPDGDSNADIVLNHLSITDNSIGSPGVIAHRSPVTLNRSIIWQPGKTVRDTGASSGTLDGSYVLANETASIPDVSNRLASYDPGFINPTLKDYHLRAGSEAIDRMAYSLVQDSSKDLDRLNRSIDLALVPNVSGPVDLGAYERQSISNIMVNDSFNVDLSQWALPYPGLVSRDSNNGSGPSGSGSLKVDGAISGGAQSVTVAKQCQVLPGPSDYRLSGWGRSPSASMVSPGDGLRLHWKVFTPIFPAYGCTGIVIDEGDVVIPATTSWMQSPTPGQFSISIQDYNANAAVEISLVARDAFVPDAQGYRDYHVVFDGIVLEAGGGSEIFADGFE